MSDKLAMESWPLRRYDIAMPFRYHLSAGPPDSGIVVCLHGYQDHALSMIRRIGWWEATDLPFQILALNGPFPAPIWSKDGFHEAYSWYFRDSSRNLQYLPPEPTAHCIRKLVNDIGLHDRQKVIFGFSQGGYFAPYLAESLTQVRGIIGLGSGYPFDAYAKCPPMTVHAVHGEKDERIPIQVIKADFAKVLSQQRHHGQFHALPELTHKVEPSVEPLIRKLALDCFAKGGSP